MHSSLPRDFVPAFGTQNPCCDQNAIAIVLLLIIYWHLIWSSIEVLRDAGIAYERINPAVFPPPDTRVWSYTVKVDKLHS